MALQQLANPTCSQHKYEPSRSLQHDNHGHHEIMIMIIYMMMTMMTMKMMMMMMSMTMMMTTTMISTNRDNIFNRHSGSDQSFPIVDSMENMQLVASAPRYLNPSPPPLPPRVKTHYLPHFCRRPFFFIMHLTYAIIAGGL
jgi:hypothetical protein